MFTNLVSLESLLNLLLNNANILNFSEVDKMSLLLYWVTYIVLSFFCIAILFHHRKIVLSY